MPPGFLIPRATFRRLIGPLQTRSDASAGRRRARETATAGAIDRPIRPQRLQQTRARAPCSDLSPPLPCSTRIIIRVESMSRDAQMDHFVEPQAGRVRGQQHRPMFPIRGLRDAPARSPRAQDHRELDRLARPGNRERRPVALQRRVIEEAETVHDDVHVLQDRCRSRRRWRKYACTS